MLKQQLQQKLQQKLSPAQIQVIKMLEIPTLELEERIRQEIEENPALEEGVDNSEQTDDDLQAEDKTDEWEESNDNDDFDIDDYMSDDDIPDYRLNISNTSKDDKQHDIPFTAGLTFHEYLSDQIGLLQLTDHERDLVNYIIGNIDDEGYLRRDAESMVDDIVFQAGVETDDDEMKRLIKLVQQLDPAGVCAKDLKECLLLQLERCEPTESVLTARKIISNHFEEFSKKHYDKIIRIVNIDENQLKAALHEIKRLNPKPGSAWSGNILEKSLSTIVPDFIVENNVLLTSLEDLLSRADYVSMNTDLNPTSRHLMNEKTFALMKPSAVIINTSRGPIVQEPALIAALRERRIAGAGIDVYDI